MHCDCARSLIEALTDPAGDGETRPTAHTEPASSCLWCGEPSTEPEPASLPAAR